MLQTGNIVAGNEPIHRALLKQVKAAQKEREAEAAATPTPAA